MRKNHIVKLVDVRINNSSQLAGFAKGGDLEYFVKHICNADYVHITDFAPTKDLLSKWRKGEVNWEQYTKIYLDLLKERSIIKKWVLKPLIIHVSCVVKIHLKCVIADSWSNI